VLPVDLERCRSAFLQRASWVIEPASAPARPGGAVVAPPWQRVTVGGVPNGHPRAVTMRIEGLNEKLPTATHILSFSFSLFISYLIDDVSEEQHSTPREPR
jgi:hypothetical protein